jgi:hypothetical protein
MTARLASRQSASSEPQDLPAEVVVVARIRFAYPEASDSCDPWCPVGMLTFELALNEYWLSENSSSGDTPTHHTRLPHQPAYHRPTNPFTIRRPLPTQWVERKFVPHGHPPKPIHDDIGLSRSMADGVDHFQWVLE